MRKDQPDTLYGRTNGQSPLVREAFRIFRQEKNFYLINRDSSVPRMTLYSWESRGMRQVDQLNLALGAAGYELKIVKKEN